jgi:hypothetical protein
MPRTPPLLALSTPLKTVHPVQPLWVTPDRACTATAAPLVVGGYITHRPKLGLDQQWVGATTSLLNQQHLNPDNDYATMNHGATCAAATTAQNTRPASVCRVTNTAKWSRVKTGSACATVHPSPHQHISQLH